MRPARQFARASLALVASLLLSVSIGEARDARRGHGDEIIGELPPMTRQSFDAIVVEMAPLKPYKKGAAPTAKASKPAAAPVAGAKPNEIKPAEAAAKAPDAPAPVASAPVAAAAPALAEAPVEAKTQAPPAGGPAPVDLVEAKPTPSAPVEAPAPTVAPPIEKAEAAKPDGSGQSPLPSDSVAPPQVDQKVSDQKPAPVVETLNAPPDAPAAPATEPVVADPAPATAAPVETAPVAENPPPAPAPEAPAPVAEADKPMPETAPVAEADKTMPESAPQIPDDWARLRELGVVGPAEVRIADRATLWLPAGRFYVPAEKLRIFVADKNLVWSEANLGAIFGQTREVRWNADVALLDDGHIKDEDAKSLDPDKALEAFRASGAPQNAKDAAPVADWVEAPRYDEKRRLTYCVGAAAQGSPDRLVNCSSLALGRQGAIKISLAMTAADFASVKNEAAALVDVIVYDRGKAYADADPAADKMAGYGVAALATRLGVSAPLFGLTPVAAAEEEIGLPWSILAAIGDDWMLWIAALAVLALLLGRRRARKASLAEGPQADEPARDKPAVANVSRWARLAAEVKTKFAGLRGGGEAAAVLGATPVSPAAKPTAKAVSKTAPEASGGGPASALAKLAATMRASAPLPVAAVAPSGARMARASTPAPVAESAAPVAVAAIDDVGLVEPGDAEAASAAIGARRRLRDARA
jgi:uncharacterized membrane-anchored protein